MDTQEHTIEFAFATHIGKRVKQEDAYGNVGDSLFVVADGVSIPHYGDIAANLAIKEAKKTYERYTDKEPIERTLIRLFLHANENIVSTCKQDSRFWGMSTTMLVAMVKGNHWWVGNVGDSRGYFYTGGKLSQITHDQEDAAGSITQAIGMEEEPIPDLYEGEARSGDMLLLATDGLFSVIQNWKIEETLLIDHGVQNIAKDLVNTPIQLGGTDNITVCVIGWK